MLETIIFSKNRPCQLDALLRSLKHWLPELCDSVHIISKATTAAHEDGYRICQQENQWAVMLAESVFREDVFALLSGRPYVVFLTDDDLAVNGLGESDPTDFLDEDDEVLTFSLRLGLNTTECYSMRRPQKTPFFLLNTERALDWSWHQSRTNDGFDWAYPCSLDGHIFRTSDIEAMLGPVDFTNPNTMEDALASSQDPLLRDRWLMCAYPSSCIVGCPVNRVNTTHPNRFGNFYPNSADALTSLYLDGHRIKVTNPMRPNAAHQEIDYEWEPL